MISQTIDTRRDSISSAIQSLLSELATLTETSPLAEPPKSFETREEMMAAVVKALHSPSDLTEDVVVAALQAVASIHDRVISLLRNRRFDEASATLTQAVNLWRDVRIKGRGGVSHHQELLSLVHERNERIRQAIEKMKEGGAVAPPSTFWSRGVATVAAPRERRLLGGPLRPLFCHSLASASSSRPFSGVGLKNASEGVVTKPHRLTPLPPSAERSDGAPLLESEAPRTAAARAIGAATTPTELIDALWRRYDELRSPMSSAASKEERPHRAVCRARRDAETSNEAPAPLRTRTAGATMWAVTRLDVAWAARTPSPPAPRLQSTTSVLSPPTGLQTYRSTLRESQAKKQEQEKRFEELEKHMVVPVVEAHVGSTVHHHITKKVLERRKEKAIQGREQQWEPAVELPEFTQMAQSPSYHSLVPVVLTRSVIPKPRSVGNFLHGVIPLKELHRLPDWTVVSWTMFEGCFEMVLACSRVQRVVRGHLARVLYRAMQARVQVCIAEQQRLTDVSHVLLSAYQMRVAKLRVREMARRVRYLCDQRAELEETASFDGESDRESPTVGGGFGGATRMTSLLADVVALRRRSPLGRHSRFSRTLRLDETKRASRRPTQNQVVRRIKCWWATYRWKVFARLVGSTTQLVEYLTRRADAPLRLPERWPNALTRRSNTTKKSSSLVVVMLESLEEASEQSLTEKTPRMSPEAATLLLQRVGRGHFCRFLAFQMDWGRQSVLTRMSESYVRSGRIVLTPAESLRLSMREVSVRGVTEVSESAIPPLVHRSLIESIGLRAQEARVRRRHAAAIQAFLRARRSALLQRWLKEEWAAWTIQQAWKTHSSRLGRPQLTRFRRTSSKVGKREKRRRRKKSSIATSLSRTAMPHDLRM